MHTHTTIQNAFRTQNTFSIKGCNHGNGGYYFSKRLWANVHHVYWMFVSTCKNILLPAHIPNTSSIAGDALSTCTAEWTAFNCMTQLTETLLVSALAQQPHAISILLCYLTRWCFALQRILVALFPSSQSCAQFRNGPCDSSGIHSTWFSYQLSSSPIHLSFYLY